MADSKKKVALLSNVTVDLIASKLRRKYDVYFPDGFDTWVQEAINIESGVYKNNVDAVVVLLDGTEARAWKSVEEGIERLSLWKQAVASLVNSMTKLPVFISTIDIRENRIKSLSERKYDKELQNDWYQFVQRTIDENNNIYILDIADAITDIGRSHFYSNKMWYMSSMPYSRDGITAVCTEIERVLASVFEPRKKVIVLDLDNTLWGGVIGEVGVEGIELSDHKEGQRYYDFQRQLLEMKNRGIVLTLNSKNNEEDAENAIRTHPAMLLRDNDFVNKKINWKNKATNFEAIKNELNLTEAGFIFIDDNPMERETIKGECPEVFVPDFPEDTTGLLEFAENLWFDYCRPLRVLGEDLNKTQMYQDEEKRRQEKNKSLDLDDYIKKLDMSVDIHRMKPKEKERVVQLLGKTNQFNLTTRRYTATQIDEIEADPKNDIYVVYSSDKYGDNGLISVIILRETGQEIYIDTFLMSCRVMGRKLEHVIINELADKYRKKMIGEFIPTDKNIPVKELFDRLGFTLISDENGHRTYELNSGYKKKDIGGYREIHFEG